MNILVVLKKLEELEIAMSKTYQWIAQLFPQERQVCDFFNNMAVDEYAHYEYVRYQSRMVRRAPKDYGEVNVDIADIERTLAEVARFRASNPTVKDAIRFALHIETEVTERLATTLMAQSNKEFAAFLNQLAGPMQQDHYKALITFAKSYGR